MCTEVILKFSPNCYIFLLLAKFFDASTTGFLRVFFKQNQYAIVTELKLFPGYLQTHAERQDRFERPEFGGMRRAKSESAMAMEEDPLSRSLKQNNEMPQRRRGDLNSKLSRSIHDLSRDHTLTEVYHFLLT